MVAVKEEDVATDDDDDDDEESHHIATNNLKIEEDTDNDHQANMQRKKPAKVYQPSSLLHLATQVAASNLEKFPPGAIGVALSEYHWDAIIKARVAMKKEC